MVSPPWITLGLLATLARADFFVSLNGSDTAAGTAHAPFKSFERAQKAVRGVVNTTNDDVKVYIAPGTYYLDEPLLFTDLDSGNNGHTVIWEAQDMDKGVNISGGYVTPFFLSNDEKLTTDNSTPALPSPTGLLPTLAEEYTRLQHPLDSGLVTFLPIRSMLSGPIMLSTELGSPITLRVTG